MSWQRRGLQNPKKSQPSLSNRTSCPFPKSRSLNFDPSHCHIIATFEPSNHRGGSTRIEVGHAHQGRKSTRVEVGEEVTPRTQEYKDGGGTLTSRTQPSNQDQGSTGMEAGEAVTPRAQ